ncbi:MAG: hypothetical protein EOM73_12975 [Bacteroidia bacterium]|nr:hypothetical protein [Bacteroidia bacterium]
MKIQTLKNNLLEAYSAVNLNVISAILLNLYKKQQFSTLQKFTEMISEFVPVEIDEYGKGFSKLMMLYHPDRGNIHRTEIEKLASENNIDALLQYSHILKLERIEEMATALESFDDIDYSPVYAWDFKEDEFIVLNEHDIRRSEKKQHFNTKKTPGVSFYDAVKIRQYGHVRTEFPVSYLEDIDEFELSGSNIHDLDGLQYCIHTQNIDLSDNEIDDISHFEKLLQIEILNLSDNHIEFVDSLEYLNNLRELNLSNNRIKDISPLFTLENLEFADLTGNPVPPFQIKKLREMGKTVEY